MIASITTTAAAKRTPSGIVATGNPLGGTPLCGERESEQRTPALDDRKHHDHRGREADAFRDRRDRESARRIPGLRGK
jgi:hypothetical protein